MLVPVLQLTPELADTLLVGPIVAERSRSVLHCLRPMASALNVSRTATEVVAGTPYVNAPDNWKVAKANYRDEESVSLTQYGDIRYTVSDKEGNITARVEIDTTKAAVAAAVVCFCENLGESYGDEASLNASDELLDGIVAATLKARETNQTRRARLAKEVSTMAAGESLVK
jgi:hypothetical protein